MRLEINDYHGTMEMESLFFGESEKAYFKTEEIQDIKVLNTPVYKKETQQLIKNKKLIHPKEKDEIRILSCDIALLGGDDNDASIYTLISGKKTRNGKRYKREVLNMESYQGVHPETQALIIRRLFDDFDCDYIVLDRQGNGISVYGYLCRKMYDNERKKEYIPFYSMNEKDDPKLEMFHSEEEYEEKIFTISATEEFNNDIAIDLKDKIVNKRISFLISKNDGREVFANEPWFSKLSTEDQVQLLLPFTQTTLLENEMVLLERIEHQKYVKLKEQPGKRKDRYTSLAYGNHFITLLERKLNIHESTLNISNYLLFN